MEIAETMSLGSGILVEETMLSTDSTKELGITGTESAICGETLLDEMESYLEDINARLIALRMVSDSVIKGMVNAIQEEAAEKIYLKEAEVVKLSERLQYYESFADNSRNFDSVLENQNKELLSNAGFKGLFQWSPEGGSLNDLLSELGWEEVVQTLVSSLQDEFETKMFEQQSLVNTMNKNLRQRIDEIFSMRQDLNAISRSLSNFDSGFLVSHRTNDKIDECVHLIEKSDETGKLISIDSPQLLCMSKEELITYFKIEMYEMKRQHETALHVKTEELFSLKRDFLKEKGSSPLHFSKEKDIEFVKKVISGLILKIDGIITENKKLSIVFDDKNISHGLKARINTFVLESQWLQRLMADVKKEAKCIASQVSTEKNLTEEVERLQLAIEEVKVEATIKEEKYKSLVEDLTAEVERGKEYLETMSKVIDDNYSIIYRGAIADAHSSINPIVVEVYKEKDSINAELSEKKKVLCLKVEENESLKQEVALLSSLIQEKEQLALDSRSQLQMHKQQFDLLCDEKNLYKGNSSELEMIIANMEHESVLLKNKLDETFQQINQKEAEITNINQKLMITSAALEEMKRQNDILYYNIQEKQAELDEAITKEKGQKVQLNSIVIFTKELSNIISDCERRLIQKMEMNDSRLNLLTEQCHQLRKQGNLLKRKVLRYQERLKTRCDDLQKAETEVDLLGDEVDTLLALLEKIYIALDHYSLVLQHYPGVVETLELIRREMNGESIKSK